MRLPAVAMTVRRIARGMAFRRMMRAVAAWLVGGAVDADAPKRRRAEKAGDQRAEQRQENDEDEVHVLPAVSPSSD